MARKGERLSAETRAKITGRPISSSTEPSTVHQWLTAHHEKAGACNKCGRSGRTDWAYLHHPQPHTRNRDDYLELCRKCHRKMDDPIYGWSKQLPKAATRAQRQAAGRKGAAVRWGLMLYMMAMCAARYREKDELDLAWNKIRRRVTRELDTRIMDFREELLNELLVVAWDKYTASLEAGEKPELEDVASEWIDAHLREHLTPALEGVRDAVAGK